MGPAWPAKWPGCRRRSRNWKKRCWHHLPPRPQARRCSAHTSYGGKISQSVDLPTISSKLLYLLLELAGIVSCTRRAHSNLSSINAICAFLVNLPRSFRVSGDESFCFGICKSFILWGKNTEIEKVLQPCAMAARCKHQGALGVSSSTVLRQDSLGNQAYISAYLLIEPTG